MKLVALFIFFIIAGFTFQPLQNDFQVKVKPPFIMNFKSLNENKVKVWLDSKDSILNRSFMINLKDYDDKLLNNFFKINYDSKDKITVLSEHVNPGFNWIKIQNLERRIMC